MPFHARSTRGGEARPLRGCFWLGVSVGAVLMQAAGALGSHIVMNVTPSPPPRLLLASVPPSPLRLGMLVLLTPPDAMVPSLGPLRAVVKMVAGLPGDAMCWTPDTMVVHGTAYVRQPQHAALGMPRPVSPTQDQVVVVGAHPLSPIARRRTRARGAAVGTIDTPMDLGREGSDTR